MLIMSVQYKSGCQIHDLVETADLDDQKERHRHDDWPGLIIIITVYKVIKSPLFFSISMARFSFLSLIRCCDCSSCGL